MTVEIFTHDLGDLVEVVVPPDVVFVATSTADLDVHAVITDVVVIPANVTRSGMIEVVTQGPQGVQGNTGSQGAVGQTGPSPTYEMAFNIATDIWVVDHPLNTRPSVTTLDLNGDEVIGDVSYTDNSQVIITFGMPFAGRAMLKA